MMKYLKSRRFWALSVVTAAVLGWLFTTDPDGGAMTKAMLQDLISGLLVVVLIHIVRKVKFPYIDLKELVDKAKQNATGAGMVVMAVMFFMGMALLAFAPRAHAQDVRTFVPAGAATYAPVLKAEQVRLWSDHPMPSVLAALVEQESCVSLRNSRCWNPAARLKTDREEGAGFGQITRAYHSDGSVRFDALAAARGLDPSLAEWNWSNVYRRPDLQLRAIVAMNRDCYRHVAVLVKDPVARLAMCDAAYNGGYGGMQAERRACGQRHGCDAQQWFRNVEAVCLKSKVRWKGYGASACEINRGHVTNVMIVRRPKYIQLMG